MTTRELEARVADLEEKLTKTEALLEEARKFVRSYQYPLTGDHYRHGLEFMGNRDEVLRNLRRDGMELREALNKTQRSLARVTKEKQEAKERLGYLDKRLIPWIEMRHRRPSVGQTCFILNDQDQVHRGIFVKKDDRDVFLVTMPAIEMEGTWWMPFPEAPDSEVFDNAQAPFPLEI